MLRTRKLWDLETAAGATTNTGQYYDAGLLRPWWRKRGAVKKVLSQILCKRQLVRSLWLGIAPDKGLDIDVIAAVFDALTAADLPGYCGDVAAEDTSYGGSHAYSCGIGFGATGAASRVLCSRLPLLKEVRATELHRDGSDRPKQSLERAPGTPNGLRPRPVVAPGS